MIAIPLRNEEATIGACLDALSRQTADFDQVLLLLNNCTDGSLRICERFSRYSEKFTIVARDLQGHRACAGEARRLALNQAAEIAGEGVVLTTDADGVPDPNWVADNLRAIAGGADVVCGMAALDLRDGVSLPDDMRIDEANEALLLSIQDEIAAIIDPDPLDPWPRHQHHSGASLAMRAPILRKAGGAPHVATGEDRALIERLLLVDAAIRHAPEIMVRVSARLEGRAAGGMAATLKRRMHQRDVLTDERLEPVIDAYRRVLAKTRLRAAVFGLQTADLLADDLLLGAGKMRQALRAPYFGAAWADIQRQSPVLQRRRVEFSNLDREIRQGLRLRDQLREETLKIGLPGTGGNSAGKDSGGRDSGGKLSSDENAS